MGSMMRDDSHFRMQQSAPVLRLDCSSLVEGVKNSVTGWRGKWHEKDLGRLLTAAQAPAALTALQLTSLALCSVAHLTHTALTVVPHRRHANFRPKLWRPEDDFNPKTLEDPLLSRVPQDLESVHYPGLVIFAATINNQYPTYTTLSVQFHHNLSECSLSHSRGPIGRAVARLVG